MTKDEVDVYDEPTYFVGDQAIELTWSGSGKLLASYNLADMSWWEAATGDQFNLATCQDWAQSSVEVTRDSLEQSPDSLNKRYVQSMMEPHFEITDGDRTLTLSNEFYTYEFSGDGSVDPERLKRFLAYDRLKAYRKAMLFREHPPFMQLKIDDLLEERSMFPHLTELSVKTPGVESKSTITMTVQPVTEDEMELLRGFVE